MNPFFDRLSEEHRHALSQLDILEAAVSMLATHGWHGDAFDGVHSSLGYIGNELRAHHAREEEHLFPEMAKLLPSAGPISVMLAEHRALWDVLAQLEELLAGAGENTPGTTFVRVQQQTSFLVQLLRSHIAKEDNILFPMAARSLSAQQLQHLADTDSAQFPRQE